MKKNIFTVKEKDLTKPVHYTIRTSLVKKILRDSKKYKISASKVVDTILYEYYKNEEE